MKKDNKFLEQGFIVAIIASCMREASITIQIVAYVVLIIFCLINLIKAVRGKSLKVAVVAMTSLLVFLIYVLGGIVAEEYAHKYIYLFDSSISWVFSTLLVFIMVISFGIYGYKNVDVDSRDIWLKNIKILSVAFLIVLCLYGLMCIIFP